MPSGKILESLAAALLFAGAFIFRGRLLKLSVQQSEKIPSFAGGAGVAYVFVHLWPEVELGRHVFLDATAHLSWYTREHTVYIATMLGFVIFYGLQKFAMSSHPKERTPARFPILLGMLGLYAFLVTYLLLHPLEEGLLPLEIYAGALALHFAMIAHSLYLQYGARYDRIGSWVLAAFVLAGWGIGLCVDVPKPMVVLLLAWVAGGVIANTLTIDLSEDHEGKFLPFLAGAICYTALLLVAL